VRVVLTRLSALGDIVHTWPLVEALTGCSEPVELAWVVEEPFLPLAALHPGVARAVPVATRRWRRRPLAAATRRELGAARRALREFSPEVALDPQGLCKSAAWGWLSGAGERVGLERRLRRELLAGACYTRTVAPPPEATHVVDINLAFGAAVGRPSPQGASPDGSFLLPRAPEVPGASAGAVGLLPGTGGRGKAWPARNFAALAARAIGRGLPVIVLWGPGERSLAESIVADCPEAGLAPPTDLLELVGLLSRCAAVVGGDTGPVHLAAALAVPTVAVFVATDPERNGTRGRRVRIVSSARAGAERGRARSGALGEATVDEVFAALVDVLGAAR